MPGRGRRRTARDSLRGDDLEGAARLEPGRAARGLQLLPRPPVESALADDADGGDPLQLTYGEFDATAPRWSPDGRRIAYISNEGGNTSLWIVDVPGGRRDPVRDRAGACTWRPIGTLRVVVTDGRDGRAPARVSVTGPDGRSFAPDNAWRHADDGFDRAERRFEYGYFQPPGRDASPLPAGRYSRRGLPRARVPRRAPHGGRRAGRDTIAARRRSDGWATCRARVVQRATSTST